MRGRMGEWENGRMGEWEKRTWDEQECTLGNSPFEGGQGDVERRRNKCLL